MVGACGPVRAGQGEYIEFDYAGAGHGVVASNAGYLLGKFVGQHGIGRVYQAETGFILERDPDTVRGPAVGYLSFPRADHPLDDEAFIEGPPDLAVEVVSPNDREQDVAAKVADFLAAGTPLVWVIRAKDRSVTVHGESGEVRVLGESEMLDGGEVLPGFAVEVGRFFE